MSAEFSNTYQEILFDNLVSIIKQNFVFQTQLKLSEKIGAEKADLQAKLNDVSFKYENVLKQFQETKNQVNSLEQLKARAEINSSIFEEKERIQMALNDVMGKNTVLTKKLEDKEMEISELKKQIEKLEEIAPASKLKKIGIEKKKELVESAPPVEEQKKVDDGSSF